MRRCITAWLAAVLLFSAFTADAREQCPYFRDPAYWARTPVAAARPGEVTVGTLNAFRLFDAEQDRHERVWPTQAEFDARIQRIARYIAHDMGGPLLLGMQEIEDETSANALAAALKRETGREYRYVLGDVAGDGDIRSALFLAMPLRVLATQSLFARTPRAGLPLHDRLPLVVDVDTGEALPLRLVVVHMKSMRGLDGRDAEDAKRVADKRLYQARELAGWVRGEVGAGRRVIVLGDFNAMTGAAGDARAEPLRILLAESGLVDVAGRFLKPTQRWTYRYRCGLDELDHLFVAPALRESVAGYAISRGDTCLRAKEKCDPSRSVSDHEGVVLRLRR